MATIKKQLKTDSSKLSHDIIKFINKVEEEELTQEDWYIEFKNMLCRILN